MSSVDENNEVIDISESNILKQEAARAREERSLGFRERAAARRRFKERFMARGGQQDEEAKVELPPERVLITPGRSQPQTAPISRRELDTVRARRRIAAEVEREEAALQRKRNLKMQQEAMLQARANDYNWDFSYEPRKEPDETKYMFRYRQMLRQKRNYSDSQTKMARNIALARCKYSEQ